MKNAACLVIFWLSLVSSINGQFVSPIPVFEKEIRDNTSTKMRSVDLDRVKRDSRKNDTANLGRASVNHFLEIKEDFEKIQKLESGIVQVYTTGKQIQYAKIASFSAEMSTSAARLNTNLFSLANETTKDATDAQTAEKTEKAVPTEVKNLIVELDNTIGAFVNNPIFQNSKKVKLEEKERAEADLRQIIRLSAALQQAAERQTQAKN